MVEKASSQLSPRLILQHAAERGQERQRERVGKVEERILSLRERFGRAKEKVRDGWRSAKETGRETGVKVRGALLTAEALADDPQVHAEMEDYARQRFEEGRENVNRKIGEIREGFNDRRDKARNRASELINTIKRGVNERVIAPTVERAKKIGKDVIKGAKVGALFTVGVAVAPVVGAYELGKAGYKVGKAGVEAGKKLATDVKMTAEQKVKQAKEKAREWGGRLRSYFDRQGERVKQDIRIGVAEVQATGLAFSNAPDLLRARLGEMQYEVHAARTERKQRALERKREALEKRRSAGEVLKRRMAETRDKIRERQEKAIGLRQAARSLRPPERGLKI